MAAASSFCLENVGDGDTCGETRIRRLNLIFLGEKQTGKTALMNRILHDATNDKVYNVEVDNDTKVITLQSEGKSLELHLVDTSGLERHRSTISNFIRQSTVFIVVYDVTDVESFRLTSKWVDVVRSEHGEDSIISLVGNKIERLSDRQVSTGEGQERANALNTMFIETSAVAGPNVTVLFHNVVATILHKGPDDDLTHKIHHQDDSGCRIF